MKKIINILAIFGALGLSSCELDMLPYDGLPEEQVFTEEVGVAGATVGNYYYIKDSYYQRHFHFFGEYGGDNVSLSGTTSDHLFYCYNYQHFADMGPTTNFWRKAYQAIVGCNKVIGRIENGVSEEMDQLKGENLFLRAMAYFHLSNTFGRPYSQNPTENLSVPLKLDDDVENIPARATVKEVYDQVVADLLLAETLMGSDKSNVYASKEVAQALLSRVYLYMGEDAKAAEYATKVINSGRYVLLGTEKYKKYFTFDPETNEESIFVIKHLPDVDDQGWNSLGSMYYQSEDGKGYGEMYASRPFRELLDRYPEDARHSFIEPQYKKDDDGNIVVDENGDPVLQDRNGYPKYFINKYSNQEGEVTLSSPVMLRLAEMYLNRAEANAKLGNDGEAIDDVNEIRQRAGLSGDALYTTADLKGHNNVLEVVLEERRLELAFEAHRRWDVFRNGLTLDRTYPGTHDKGNALLEIPANHPRVIFFIPQDEINAQPNLVQNP